MRGELELSDQPRPERNPAAVYIGRLGSAASRRVMRDALNLIATEALGVPVHVRVGQPPDSSAARLRRTPQEDVTYLYCAWGALRSPHTRAIRDWLAAETEETEPRRYGPPRYAPATVNRMLAALRGVLKEACRLGLMRDEDYHLAAIDLRGIRAASSPRGRSLSHGELAALLACCRREREYYRQLPRRLPRDARDAALIATLYSIGLRRFEIVALDLDDYDRVAGALRIRSGRPWQERECYLASGAVSAMTDWLAIRGASPGPLFCSLPKSGVVTGRRLSDQAIYHIVQVRQRQARVPTFSPQDLRRTCTTDLQGAGVLTSTTRQILGKTRKTTTTYNRRDGGEMKAAADKLDVPYAGRDRGARSRTPGKQKNAE